jgi:arylsulfatase A-like enzyme
MTELDLWHNTLFIITADHGDEFLDHGTGGHGHSLYQELIHVPLVMSFPQGEFGGMKIDESVTLLDIMPTILDYIKAENKPPMEGTSLLTLLQKDSLSYRSHRKPYFGSVQPLEPEWRYWKMEAIIKGEYKYIRNYPHNSQQYRTELFNLALDEKEKQNLADSLFIIKDSLSKDMDGLIAYCDSAASTIAPMEKALKLSKTQREQLKALGYIK